MIGRLTASLLMLCTTTRQLAVADEQKMTSKPHMLVLPISPKVHITEVCVIPPPGKNWPAWVELWNNANTNVSIKDYTLCTLQATYKPFPDETVLGSNERLVVLFYVGDKKDDDFEKKIPVAVQRVRVFNATVFPPHTSLQNWISKLPDSYMESARDGLKALSPDERNARLGDTQSLRIGSTRFANEVALRTQNGDLVAYVVWGGKEYTSTVAREEAIKKGFCVEEGIPRLFIGDSKCVVLQLLAPLHVSGDTEDERLKGWRQNMSGFYRSLTRPEDNCSPGAPMNLDVRAPELLPVKPCRVDDGPGGKCVFLEIRLEEGITDQGFERTFGWSRELCEICYDREMKRPVFKPDVNQFKRPWENGLRLPLRPSVYRQLEGKILFVRASKRHKQKGVLYSSVLEVKISHDGSDPIPQDSGGTNSVPGWQNWQTRMRMLRHCLGQPRLQPGQPMKVIVCRRQEVTV
jgi:hypothetical protein